ncbi:MAG: LuxR C-terminal-related transcriptional regulator [Methylomonas sp.]|nr:LuxR C-terminal-related transcriptional regulator [Methylomonas sp.]
MPRLPLLQRLQALTTLCRVTLVCAPAGFGKSTLLAQFAAQPGQAVETVWLSLDEDDNDPNRLFVSLLGVLRKIPLEWPADPQMLASQVDSGGPGARAAVAGLINALCSYRGERLLLIIDDLHRINDEGALRLLDAMIDRLPPEVGVVIGARVEPELSLPRWRAHGELGELLAADLQFNETEAFAFAGARLADTVSPELVQQALARTQGWVAGLQLLFGSANMIARPGSEAPIGDADRHLFDYFAAEVLAELPPDLRDFVLQCSILPELDPARCAAVTGRSDMRQALVELYRRNLFLTVLDEKTPVLRLHDLFRDYLQNELARCSPGLTEELHAKAAAAEPVSPRAVMHWLKARCWEEAVALIQRCAEPLLAEGGFALIERWIQQLPEEMQQQRPEVAYLQGMCRWVQYDFIGMREPLERACAGYRLRGDTGSLARTLFTLTRSLQSTGDLASCAALLQEAESLELDPHLRAAFYSVRACQALADGRPDDVAPALQAMVDAAELDITTLYPAVSDVFNGFFYGLPGAQAPLQRLHELCVAWSKRQPVHWQVEAMAHTALPYFWHGDRQATAAALEGQWRFHERMAGLPALWLNLHRLTSWMLATGGEFEQAITMHRRNFQIVDSPAFGTLAASWRRQLILYLACVYWMAQDVQGLAQLLPILKPARRPEEWPVLDVGRALAEGRHALLAGQLIEAESALSRAQELYRSWRIPSYMGNPRISLALLRLAQGDRYAAWAEFKPVLDEALNEDCIGDLLLEPREPLARLLGLIPSAERKGYDAILARLATWRTAPLSPVASGDNSHRLSERELEVLQRIAGGDSNKQIARTLELSPHTVKRHVANILAKLDAATRRQAAAWWREHYGGAG